MKFYTKAISLLFLMVLVNPFAGNSQCTLGAELVTNGGFETCLTPPCSGTNVAGNQTDYSPDYAPGGSCPPGIYGGAYAITSDAGSCYSGWLPAANTAHTGSYAMLIDGLGNSKLWCQTVAVAAGTTYEFSAWYQNAVKSGVSPGEIPEIQLYINGTSITTGTAVLDYLAGWQQNKCLWKAPTATTSATICIQLVATSSTAGNDVIIDDISFKPITGGSCTSGTCSYTGSTSVFVPVELVSLTANHVHDKAIIAWTTASEKKLSYFAVEKSGDGITFSEIGTAEAKGSSAEKTDYEYEDLSYTKTSYYRLRMVDIDGYYEYSGTASLKRSNEYIRIIKTNLGELEIKAVINEDAQWNLSIYSLLGQEHVNEKISLIKGDNSIVKRICCDEKNPKIIRITDAKGTILLSEVLGW